MHAGLVDQHFWAPHEAAQKEKEKKTVFPVTQIQISILNNLELVHEENQSTARGGDCVTSSN